MKVPSLVFSDLHDERYRFDKYWDKLEDLDINTPKTHIIKLNNTGEKDIPDCPVDRIIQFMDRNDLNQAFLRSGYKASVNRLKDGSIISRKDKDHIVETYNSLISQHLFHNIPHGYVLVVRERLDLEYCMYSNHSHSPEIRYFIEDGDIIGKTPNESNIDPIPKCDKKYSFLEDQMQDITYPDRIALKVADTFKSSKYPWSLDIILDANGDWYATEMHIDGVYYNDQYEEWWNVCGHGDIEYLSPLWMHSAALYPHKPGE